MYDWLERELGVIKTPKFHLVDGPATPELREVILHSRLRLPTAYKEFVLQFGNAKLYRKSRNDSYSIGIFAMPREAQLDDETRVYEIGFHDGAKVYVEAATGLAEGAVWEIEAGASERVGEDFVEWLADSCARVRSRFGAEKWAEILRGPEPFTPEENEIVEARRRIGWRVVRIDEDGNHVFEITNASNRTLPTLTVGVRSRDRRLNGAVLLNIGNIDPGQKAIVHAGCYKGLKQPQEIEVFHLPDPKPEDREFYGEFAR